MIYGSDWGCDGQTKIFNPTTGGRTIDEITTSAHLIFFSFARLKEKKQKKRTPRKQTSPPALTASAAPLAPHL